jgi:dihydroflavonol-4-reductase
LILVTGATGYIGPSLCEALLGRGSPVRALVRSSLRASGLPAGIELFEGDLTDPASLEGVERGITQVYHLAVLGHLADVDDPEQYARVNVDGTRALLDRFAGGQARFLFTTTTAALGPIAGRVATEEDDVPPVTPYGRSKRAAEGMLEDFAREHDVDFVMVRLSHVYGPGEQRDLYRIIRMIKAGVLPQVGRAPNLYPAVHLDDAVQGVLLAMERGRSGQSYIITDRDSHDLREVRRVALSAMGIQRRLYPWLPRRLTLAVAGLADRLTAATGLSLPVSRKNLAFVTAGRRFSIDKARRELGYEPRVSLDQGLRQAIAWYLQEGLL